MERLQKFLSRAGVASRRHAEALIVNGRVKVNGKTVTVLGTQVEPQKDLVLLDGKLVSANSERKYFLFYKPPGVVTTLSDPEGRPTVGDYAVDTGGRVFPVGRLDYDAEGALLLTDDGELANKLMHPSHQVPRVYLAKVKGVPDEPSLQKLIAGVRLEDGMAHAVQARVFEKAQRNTWVKIVVTEGRQHLVKRLCAAIGHPVVRLYRPAHAGLSVQGLRPGELRELTHDEVRRVKAAADGDAQPEPKLSLPARRHGHAAPGFEPDDEAEETAPLTSPADEPRERRDGASNGGETQKGRSFTPRGGGQSSAGAHRPASDGGSGRKPPPDRSGPRFSDEKGSAPGNRAGSKSSKDRVEDGRAFSRNSSFGRTERSEKRGFSKKSEHREVPKSKPFGAPAAEARGVSLPFPGEKGSGGARRPNAPPGKRTPGAFGWKEAGEGGATRNPRAARSDKPGRGNGSRNERGARKKSRGSW